VKVHWIVALSVGIPLAVLIPIVALLVYIGLYTPDTKVLAWDEVVSSGRDQVLEVVHRNEGEEFKYFYSLGFLSFKEDGNLITNERVVSYWELDGQVYINESSYDEIVGFTITPAQSWIDDTIVLVNHDDPAYDFELYFSPEAGMDKVVISYIEDRIE
jgi:type IV secretory pathway VirB9-like protein